MIIEYNTPGGYVCEEFTFPSRHDLRALHNRVGIKLPRKKKKKLFGKLKDKG